MRSARPSLVALGFATAVSQAVLLREAMAAVAGSELAWGAVLAVWLAGMAAGARIGASHGGARLGAAAPSLVLVAALGGAVLLRAAPVLAGVSPGEPLLAPAAAWLWIAAVLPAATAGGLGFPLLAGAGYGNGSAGSAYALEGTGALAGGLVFSFALAPLGAAASLLLALAVTAAAAGWRRGPAAALALAVLPAVLAFPARTWLESAGWRWSRHDAPLADWRETRQQRLELGGGEPATLFADGRLLASYPEPYLTGPRAHLLMLLHPDPRRVLAVGALADGSVTAILRHPVERLDLVEDDPALLRLVPRWFGPEVAAALQDPRVHAHRTDPVRVVSGGGPWDLVLLLDGDPTTLRQHRTRSRDFLAACRRHMAPGGVLALATGVGDTYLEGAGGRLLAVEAATLGAAFPRIAALPGERVTLVAGLPPFGLATDPETLAGRWRELSIADPVMSPDLVRVLADPERAAALDAALSETAAPVSTVRRPVAVLAAAAAIEGRGRPGLAVLLGRLLRAPPWLPVAAALAAAASPAVLSRTGVRMGNAVAATVGFTSMAWWLLLLATWQATVGSVYAEIGALTAAFMAGLVGGATLARRRHDAVRDLPVLLGLGVLLSLLVAAGTPLTFPRLTVPALLVAGGLLTGAAFPGAAALCGSDIRRGAGRAFAADEAGAACAALAVGLLVLPWAGLAATALATAVLGAGAAAALLLRRRS